MDKKQIEKQAKQILDKFAKALEKTEKEKTDESEAYVDREQFERQEAKKEKPLRDTEGTESLAFKKDFLANAPESEGDFVKVEKGDWK